MGPKKKAVGEKPPSAMLAELRIQGARSVGWNPPDRE